jgi:hypothetical protein
VVAGLATCAMGAGLMWTWTEHPEYLRHAHLVR